MVVPDSNYIAEIILFGEGFSDTRLLATKVYTLYQLCAQQLSKQGLREEYSLKIINFIIFRFL